MCRRWALPSGVSCLLPSIMASPLLVVYAGCGLDLVLDPTVVAELELPVVDAPPGGQVPPPAADMKGEKEELEPGRERRHKSKGRARRPRRSHLS